MTNSETTNLCKEDFDHTAIYHFGETIIPKIEKLTTFKEDLLQIRESKNISVRETQKVLTTLCKTIHALENFEIYLKEEAYSKEHAIEIHEEKRALRNLIKSASPDEMERFRVFLQAEKNLKTEEKNNSKTEEKKEEKKEKKNKTE